MIIYNNPYLNYPDRSCNKALHLSNDKDALNLDSWNDR